MKVILIGLGMVAGTHLLAIRDAKPAVTLIGVVGRDPVRSKAFAEQASGTLGYAVPALADADDTAIDEADFIIIATPPDARKDLVTSLVAARKPILMEKPVERTLDAAREIVALCDNANVPLGVFLQHRARAASGDLRDALATGSLGDVAMVDIRVPWWRDQEYYDVPGRGTYARDGGGVMINQAIHTLDLALWLLGPVTSLQAQMHRTPLHDLEAEDRAAALLTFASGAVGTLTATTAAWPGGPESIAIQGTRASAHLMSGVLKLHGLDGTVTTSGETAATGGGADPMAFTHAWHQTVLEDFAASLLSGKEPLASGRSALSAQAVIAAMETAARTGSVTEVSRL
ncbi:Gfo/Idh/MocA family oxidoreductase [uncultured Roseobacter sp.]|uniref:Gfo/Idh/MocA family protein n=1 Tax=uncultured Roseobacter sp. TaxID=114847 RepID=UPI002618A3A9|nr:Gfo/Idh/MocA family oxidoreductase [uncultured Roseobacter sp.]